MTDRVRYILVNTAVITLTSLLLFLAATWWRMQTQYTLGEQAMRRGDFSAAVAGYESALHMYIPFHPIIERSAQKLWTLGEANEKLGDINRALIAFRALRSSFYANHWLVTPGSSWISRCDKKIAELVPRMKER